jgi:hypothetical protein
MSTPKVPKVRPEALTRSEVKKLIEAAQKWRSQEGRRQVAYRDAGQHVDTGGPHPLASHRPGTSPHSIPGTDDWPETK